MISSSKLAVVFILLSTIILVIFSSPATVRGGELDDTPSQTSESVVDYTETATTTQPYIPALTNTSVVHLQTTNTLEAIFTANKSPSSTETMTPTPKMTATPTAPPVKEDLYLGAYVEDEVLLKIRTDKLSQDLLSNLKDENAEIRTELFNLGVFVVKVPVGTVSDFIANIKSSPDVVYVEPNYIMNVADTIPNDGGWGGQYGPIAIHAPQGWDLSTGSSAVTIAVIDTGIDQSHPDLTVKIVPGYDFVNNDSDPQDDNGHGTHVAGIAAASANNGLGIAGISWGAKLMPIKVLNASGSGSYANAALGIMWAADNGANVINLSFGGSAPSATLQAAVDYAYNKGVTIVAASGNSGTNLILYPAHYPDVIAVAATDSTNTHAGFSNYGPEMSVSAPGVLIYSSLPGGTYGYMSGSSMSAPMVSGAAAILAGLPANNNPIAITWELQSSALDLGAPGFDNFYGYGLIQLDQAIQLAVFSTPMPTVMPTLTLTPTITIALTPTLVSTRKSTLPSKFTLTVSHTPAATLTLVSEMSHTPVSRKIATSTPKPWIVFPSVLFFSGLTPSSTITLTPTLTIVAENASWIGPTFMVSPTLTQPVTENDGQIQAQAVRQDDSLLLPCLGILCILAGLGLAGVAMKLQRN